MSYIPSRIQVGVSGSGVGGSGNGAANRLAIWLNGTTLTSSASLTTTLLDLGTTGTGFRTGNGTAGAPSFSFSIDTTKGFYHSGTNFVGLSIAGAIALEWTTGVMAVYGAATTAEFAFQRSGAVGNIGLYGGGANSGRIALYGETHATLASVTQFINGGNTVGSISSTGLFTVGAVSGTAFHVLNGRGWNMTCVSSGVTAYVFLNNTSNSANSSAAMDCTVAGSLAGDAFFAANVSGVTSWAWGCDNSASDAWVLSNNAALGTSNAISIAATTLAMTLSAQLTVNFTSGADVTGLRVNGGTTTGVVRQYFYNSDASESWQFIADFNNDIFTITSNAAAAFNISKAGIVTIGTGTATTHVLNTQLGTAASDALTLLNGPAGKAGNPVYIQINVNGTNRVVPAW